MEVEKCADAEAVTVKSEDFNSITYNITAGEGQEDYLYMVYLDDVKEIGTAVLAGQDYTVTGVAGGTHTVKVVSVYDGKVSNGITSDAVEVEDISSLVTGTRNISNVKNNPDAKIISVSEFYDENFTLDTAQVVLDGLIPTGEGNSVALRTKGTPVDVILDLGADYTPKQFEQVLLAYSNPRTYAATTSVAFSLDNEVYTEVGSSTGYACQKDGGGTADLNIVSLDKEKIAVYDENAVRYIKITLSEGQSNWGYVVNEISVVIDKDVEDAEIFLGKAPTISAKFGEAVYTYSASEDGDYTADVPENAGTYYVKAEVAETNNYKGLDAVTTSFSIEKADQDAPEGMDTVKSTLAENADGKITNVTDAMEYRAEDATEYTAIEGTEIADVLAGKYYVRYKETENYNASADTEVTVEGVEEVLETTTPVVDQTTPQQTTPVQKTTVAPKTTKALGKTTVQAGSKKKADKKVKITFKKVAGAKKYQVQISKTKKFKKVLVKKTVKKVKVTIISKKLKNQKTLYVRVRAVGAKKWSRPKKVKIKK